MACNWACVIALLKLTSQLFATSPQSLRNLCCTSLQSLLYHTTIFAAPHHYLCCTSLQIHRTSSQSLLHLTTAPLDLTTIFAAPHHDLCCTSHHDLCCISPQIHGNSPQTSLRPQIRTWLITCTAKVGSKINTLWEWGLKLRSARCKWRHIKLTTSLRDFSSLIFKGTF